MQKGEEPWKTEQTSASLSLRFSRQSHSVVLDSLNAWAINELPVGQVSNDQSVVTGSAVAGATWAFARNRDSQAQVY